MNILGHNFLAKMVLNKYNADIAAGCHLPDMVPFLKNSVLSFDEIHENPEKVFTYCSENALKTDMALGLMTHSVKFGADKFNREIDNWLINENIAQKNVIAELICKSSGISYETAIGPRMHNYLWCGLDFYIIDTYRDFLNDMDNAYKEINIEKIALILNGVFNKPYELIKSDLDRHIGLVSDHNIIDKETFMKFWKDFISDLPDKDDINLDEAIKTVNFIENLYMKEWEKVMGKVAADVKHRMDNFIL